MQSIPVDSADLVFAGALDLERTGTGFIPRRLPAWTKPQITDVAMDAVVQLPAVSVSPSRRRRRPLPWICS